MVCLSGSFLSLSNPLPLAPLFLSFFLLPMHWSGPPGHWLERLALWFLTDDSWPLFFSQGWLFSSADVRVWAPKKHQLKERLESFGNTSGRALGVLWAC